MAIGDECMSIQSSQMMKQALNFKGFDIVDNLQSSGKSDETFGLKTIVMGLGEIPFLQIRQQWVKMLPMKPFWWALTKDI